jgi:hypothetical protein
VEGNEAFEFSNVCLGLLRIRTPFLLVVMMRVFVTYQSQVAVSKINLIKLSYLPNILTEA